MDFEEVRTLWEVVGSKFEEGEGGQLRNARLEVVRLRQQDVSSKRSNAAFKRWDGNAKASANDNAKNKQRKVKVKVEDKVEDGSMKVLFCNSELSNIEKVRAALPEIHAELVDLQHYSDIIRNWSDTKGEKRTDRGWLATFRQWIKRDRDESKLRKTIAAPKTVWNARA